MGSARSGLTGVSMIVDPLGRVSHRTELFESAAFVADVETTDGLTVYVRFGDIVGIASAVAAILALCASIRGRKVDRGSGGRGGRDARGADETETPAVVGGRSSRARAGREASRDRCRTPCRATRSCSR